MPHILESTYGLSADELLDALNRRFRAKVTLEGAVAEVQAEKHIQAALDAGVIDRYEAHDLDGQPDFSLWLPGVTDPIRMEVKNVRNSNEAYRKGGSIIAYKVEVQKTRAATGDPTSRLYGINQFEILAVELGKKTGDWTKFAFVATRNLERHQKHSHKLAVMHPVPIPVQIEIAPWYWSLEELLAAYTQESS